MTTVRRELIALAFVAALLFVPWLGARDLWNPNEPLYGQAVSEMAARGDWLVPTVNGSVFDEKPILYFWMARAAALTLGGVDEFTLRLPTALAGIAGSLSQAIFTPVWRKFHVGGHPDAHAGAVQRRTADYL